MGGDTNFYEPWVLTPWWHPRRWFGFTWCRLVWDTASIGGPYDGETEYLTTQQKARLALENEFGC